jgi:hypothetical protein
MEMIMKIPKRVQNFKADLISDAIAVDKRRERRSKQLEEKQLEGQVKKVDM